MHARSLLLSALVLSALLACGGSGGGSGGGSSPSAGTISGTVVAGPVGGAKVTAYAISGGAMGAPLGSATTAADGSFTVAIGDHAGPVMLQATGGSYPDEATGSTMPMLTGDVLSCALPSVEAGAATGGIQVTPLTSRAQARAHAMSGGMSAANIGAANGAMGAYFSVADILHTAPMNPLTPGAAAGATADAKNYGMTLAAMSEYARTIGMTTSSSGVVTMMAEDASDGVLDGMMGSTPISMAGMGGMMGGGMMQPTAGTTGLATAMTTFVGSAMNRSGVTLADMQALIDRLAGASGQVSGATGGTTAGTISGTAFMGRMTSGTMMAFAVAGGVMGAQLGTSQVDASGHFGMSIGSYAGPVMLQLTGGSYVDEAAGTTMTMASGDVLSAALPAVTAGATVGGVQVTPLTAMAQDRAQHMTGGMTGANVTAANQAVGSYFMVDDILMTPPMDPAVAGSGAGATAGARNHGMTIAAMSEYAKSLGMTTSSGLFAAMMEDASDGVMNGMMGSTSISMTGMGGMMGGGMMQATAGTSGLATAMTTFVGSAMNQSGVVLADLQSLVDKLSTSNGTLQ